MQHSGDNWQVAILSFYLLDLRDAAQVNVLGTRGLFPLIQFCGTKHELFKANLKKKNNFQTLKAFAHANTVVFPFKDLTTNMSYHFPFFPKIENKMDFDNNLRHKYLFLQVAKF